jgi:plastocyanin
MDMKALFIPAVLTAMLAVTPSTPTVTIKNFAYVPPRITVAAGTVVRFVNDDGEAHTVTATDRSFDSEGLDTGEAWTHRFMKPGTYAYFCELHPYMHGTVVVTVASGS